MYNSISVFIIAWGNIQERNKKYTHIYNIIVCNTRRYLGRKGHKELVVRMWLSPGQIPRRARMKETQRHRPFLLHPAPSCSHKVNPTYFMLRPLRGYSCTSFVFLYNSPCKKPWSPGSPFIPPTLIPLKIYTSYFLTPNYNSSYAPECLLLLPRKLKVNYKQNFLHFNYF